MAILEMIADQVDLVFNLDEGVECNGFRVIEKFPWKYHGKYQRQGIIFEHAGKVWRAEVERFGFGFTEYFHREYKTNTLAHEVKKVEITVQKWVRV
jgi:hypothetical protein